MQFIIVKHALIARALRAQLVPEITLRYRELSLRGGLLLEDCYQVIPCKDCQNMIEWKRYMKDYRTTRIPQNVLRFPQGVRAVLVPPQSSRKEIDPGYLEIEVAFPLRYLGLARAS